MIQNRTQQRGEPRQTSRVPEQHGLCSTAALREYVEKNPSTSILIGFCAGMGAGLLLGVLMRQTAFGGHDESIASRVSSQVRDTFDDIMPASWKKRLRS